MWKLIVTQTSIVQYSGEDYQDYVTTYWKEFEVPTERLVDVYRLFHGMYGREVFKIEQI